MAKPTYKGVRKRNREIKKGIRRFNMYISPFAVGIVIGFVVAAVLIITWALWYGKGDKK